MRWSERYKYALNSICWPDWAQAFSKSLSFPSALCPCRSLPTHTQSTHSLLPPQCYPARILWLAQSVIPPVPPFARLPAHVVDAASDQFIGLDGQYSAPLLARAFRKCRVSQPSLAAWLEQRLAGRIDDAARGFGASMAMSIWMAFTLFAGTNLGTVDPQDFRNVEELLRTDEERRCNDPDEIIESDDIIAAHQPEIARLIRNKLDETLSNYADDVDVDDVDMIYRMLLVEVLVLSYAVKPWSSRMDNGADGVS